MFEYDLLKSVSVYLGVLELPIMMTCRKSGNGRKRNRSSIVRETRRPRDGDKAYNDELIRCLSVNL